jgi:suppressor of G2 allele of SKP1
MDGDFDAAASAFDAAIEARPNVARQYASRSANHMQLQRYAEALRDADRCIELSSGGGGGRSNATAKKGHFRRGIALFYLTRYADANAAFEQAQALGWTRMGLWQRKCAAELRLLTAEKKQTTATAAVATASAAQDPTTGAVAAAAVPVVSLSSKVRMQWIQGELDVEVALLKAKKLTRDAVECTITDDAVHIVCTMPDASVYEHTWRLWASVDPAESSVRVTPFKVLVTLAKREKQQWDALEAASGDAAEAKDAVDRRANTHDGSIQAYPYSGPNKTDWDAVDRTVQEEEDAEQPEGEEALNKLFKQIFKDANPDTRRAMMKSYQTSGGTVLSTNWNEVKDTDYEKEKQAPDGQEFVDF